jgi:hypothetical protein
MTTTKWKVRLIATIYSLSVFVLVLVARSESS